MRARCRARGRARPPAQTVEQAGPTSHREHRVDSARVDRGDERPQVARVDAAIGRHPCDDRRGRRGDRGAGVVAGDDLRTEFPG